MAKDEITSDVSGLQLSNSTFSASPPGSLLRAEECVMPAKGVIQPRRGQERLATLATASTLPFAMTEFDEQLIVNSSATKTGTSYALGYVSGSSITAYSGAPFNPVDSTDVLAGRMKFAQANEYLHFCTTTGPKTLETGTGTPRASGLLRMPDPEAVMASASSLPPNEGAGLEYGFSRAYRTVLRKPTDNGTSLLSPPSGRTVVQNRILAPVGSMVRVANVVTVTLPGVADPGLDPGDTFDIDPGEATFPAATETVATQVANVITYADVAADSVNTLAQDLDTGPRPVGLIVFLSPDATTSTPVRIYRSRDVDGTDPSDELFLVNEIFPTGTNITNGFLTYLDTTPQSVTDDPLYTNPLTGEGATQANLRAPLYRDVANWSASTWYANTTGQQEIRLQMLGVGPDDGVQNGDTLTIAGSVFTFLDTPAVPGDVQIVSNGLPSFNIQQTTKFLIQSINGVFKLAGTNIRAYDESTQDGAQGKILIQATAFTQAAFAARASRPESWTPALRTSSDVNSTADRLPNSIAYSKPGQPEAVPALNYVAVGSKSYPISRILGLQQALLVFKDGDGIWTVSGQFPFQVQQISTANIIATDTACVFSDACWAYTDEGILRVSDSGGATVISRPIETELNAQLSLLPEETYGYSFAVPYEPERRVMFFVPFSFETDAGPSGDDLPLLRAWCYNEATQAWTGPLYSFAFGGYATRFFDDDGQPLLALGVLDTAWSTTRLTLERRPSLTAVESADAVFTVSISAVAVDGDPLLVELSDMTDVAAGDALAQGVTSAGIARLSTIKALRPDVSATCVELYETRSWTVASAFIAKHFEATLQFQPQGNPTARKTLTRLTWLFKPEWFQSPNAQTLVLTDQCQADNEILTAFNGFGLATTASGAGFGETPFGDPTPMVLDVNPLGQKWTNAGQFFLGLSMRVCLSKFKLEGFSLRLESQDGPTGRGR